MRISLLFLIGGILLIPFNLHSQTKTDSIAGTYSRYTAVGDPMHWITVPNPSYKPIPPVNKNDSVIDRSKKDSMAVDLMDNPFLDPDTTTVQTWTWDFGPTYQAEVSASVYSETWETLLLEKNHCAALTVNTKSEIVVTVENPVSYYGIWRMSGDTITISYSRPYSINSIFCISVVNGFDTMLAPDPMQKVSPLIVKKYLWDESRKLTPISGDNGSEFNREGILQWEVSY